MSQPVSVIIPALDTRRILRRSLQALLPVLEARGCPGDEVILVDDTGKGVLIPWAKKHFSAVRVVSMAENSGFSPAATKGFEMATNELGFLMNSDVVVHPGFLDPLVERLREPGVCCAIPRMVVEGTAEIHSLSALELKEGTVSVRRGSEDEDVDHVVPIAYPIGAAMLVRRADFLKSGGFDPLYQPFFWEDVDFGVHAWRRGQRIEYVPSSTVEHEMSATILPRVDSRLVSAIFERNRLLFQWKFLDDRELARRHVRTLIDRAVEAFHGGHREDLVSIVLALDELPRVQKRRANLRPEKWDLRTVAAESSPWNAA